MYSLGVLAFSLFSLLSAISALPSPTSKRWSSQFVSVSGSEFSVQGKDFRFIGTNAYWLPYLNSEDDICNTLANMSKAGITVVRTWAFNDVSTIPDAGSYLQLIKDGKTTINTGPNGIQRLDTVIALAKKYNIRVYFTLTNNWFPSVNADSPSSFPHNFLSNDYGGMDLYVKEFGVTKTHDEFYTNMTIRGEFNKYVEFVVSRYANEPGIIAWELANDARCDSTLPASGQCNTNTVTKWHAETAKFIRSIDPNHLITSGTHGFFCPTCPKLFPSPPPPKLPPVPGSTHKRTDSGIMSKVLRTIALERRVLSRASGANGMSVRGLWTAPSEAKRHSSNVGPAFNGAFGVDSEDILNAPDIDFGTFQLFPDQNHYGVTGTEVQPPSSNFDNTLNETVSWIRAQADTINSIGKPVVLSAFGIVAQDSLQQFVPFNSTCPLVKFQQGWKRQDSGANAGVNQQQYNSAYNSWLQQGAQGGLVGIVQYQWSSQGLTTAPGTLVPGPNGANPARRQNPNGNEGGGPSPTDGQGINGNEESGAIPALTNQANQFPSPPPPGV